MTSPWFDSDGKTLWSSDGKTIRCFDIATLKETVAIPLDKKHVPKPFPILESSTPPSESDRKQRDLADGSRAASARSEPPGSRLPRPPRPGAVPSRRAAPSSPVTVTVTVTLPL